MADGSRPQRVLLTGASGFVGGYVLKKLVSSGYVPICLVRDPDKFASRVELFASAEIVTVRGDLFSNSALRRAADQADCAVHLVGIIMERGPNTFSRVNYEGTKNVVSACQDAGIKRLVHMSALGTRTDAVSKYHQTKYMAEQCVKRSGLDWTIFRPSIIHGPDGEFMELMKTFACSLLPPFMPYFGGGCSVERLETARSFFAEPTHQVDGTEANLQKVSDQVSDCSNLRKREGQAVAGYLKQFQRGG